MSSVSSPKDFATALERLAEVDVEPWLENDGFELARRQALAAVTKMFNRLETPVEMSRRLGWQTPAHTAAMKIALDANIFEHLEERSKFQAMSAEELAKSADLPVELVQRLMRHLAAWGIVKEADSNKYAATKTSNAFLDPRIASGIDYWIYLSAHTMSYLPRNIREGGYEDLGVAGKSNWEKSHDTDQPFFAWLNGHPEALTCFTNHLAGFTMGRTNWLHMYPVHERLLPGADSTGPLVVDVGGGVGQDVQQFQDEYPQPAGRLFVQDLDQVISQAHNDPVIKMQAHDFFTPQIVHGSRAYLLHYVLHDWPDDSCLKILGHLQDAMRKDYSKLLIAEFVGASRNADPFNTSLDFTVMSIVGSKERTESDWRTLIEKAGMKINGIFTLPGNHEKVLEVVLA